MGNSYILCSLLCIFSRRNIKDMGFSMDRVVNCLQYSVNMFTGITLQVRALGSSKKDKDFMTCYFLFGARVPRPIITSTDIFVSTEESFVLGLGPSSIGMKRMASAVLMYFVQYIILQLTRKQGWDIGSQYRRRQSRLI